MILNDLPSCRRYQARAKAKLAQSADILVNQAFLNDPTN